MIDELLDKNDANQPFYSNSAYSGKDQKSTMERYKMQDMTSEKRLRNNPLADNQKRNNREKSKTRARVEHVFGFMEQLMNGLLARTIRLMRATTTIGLINLTYTPFRHEQLIR